MPSTGKAQAALSKLLYTPPPPVDREVNQTTGQEIDPHNGCPANVYYAAGSEFSQHIGSVITESSLVD